MFKRTFAIFLLVVAVLPVEAQLLINEFQASNITAILEPDGDIIQWVEIYNAGTSQVDLYGHYLTDNLDDPFQCHIGDHLLVGAGQHVIIWLERERNEYKCEFKLDMDGEEIALFSPAKEMLDHVVFGPQYIDVSYGRVSDGAPEWAYFPESTPGARNNTSAFTEPLFTGQVEFSLRGGLYPSALQVALSTTAQEGVIKYTLNGSWPTSSSSTYSGPIQVNSTTVVRARVFEDGKMPGPVATQSYILNENTALPVVSLSTDPDHFFSGYQGIYVVGYRGMTGLCMEEKVNWNRDWERPVNIEYYPPDGSQPINQLVGTKITGGCSRANPLKSLAIYARKMYGDNSLSYKFFQTKEVHEFKNIVLRNSGNDVLNTMFRDGFMQSLVMGKMDIDYQGYQPAIVYINGEYWGILNVREKINEHYGASNYSLDSDEIDMLEKEDYFKYGVVINGSGEHYEDLVNFMDWYDLSIQENFDYVATQMDVEEFLNYYLADIYFQNEDWPQNNIKYWRPQVEGGKWRWILFDTDFGWGLYPKSGNSLWWATRGASADKVINSLLENEGFKNEFIQRLASHMNTTFHPETVTPIFDSIKGIIEAEMPRHRAKWTDPTEQNFNWDVNHVMPNFTRTRPDSIRLFTMWKFGISGLYQLSASVSDPNQGWIQAAGVDLPDNFTGLYFKNIPLRLVAVPESGYSFSHWEGANSSTSTSIFLDEASDQVIRAVFRPDTPAEKVYINEVCASNSANHADEFGQYNDWIEVYNDNDHDVDLSGWFITDTDGYEKMYQFPRGRSGETTVKAKQYGIIWCDGQSSQGAMHTDFKLDSDGETLFLIQKIEGTPNIVDSVSFGAQYSDITFARNPVQDRWDYLEPTPGEANRLSMPRGVLINEFASRNEGAYLDEYGEADDWIEIYNPSPEAVDLGGLFLTDSLSDPLKHQIPAGSPLTLIPPGGYIVLWADNQPEQGILHLDFRLDGRSEQIGIYQVGAGIIDSLSYLKDYAETVQGRMPDGGEGFQIVTATPGSSNLVRVIKNVYINEFMASNGSTCADEFGGYDDWIELYNGNDFAVDIGGTFITDSLADPIKHRIPSYAPDSTTIPANGYLLLWADNQEEQGVLHLGFRLNGEGEAIGLSQPDGAQFIDTLSYHDAKSDLPVGRLEDGSVNIQFLTPTPGSGNLVRVIENVYINEFMADNGNTNADEFGGYDDWIELYNANDFPVDIGGIFFTDSLRNTTRYRIPSYAPDSTTIPPDGYLVLWADDQEEQGILHLGFKLSAKGEQIGLVQPDGKTIFDSLSYGETYINQSLGLLEGTGKKMVTVVASPGSANYINPVGTLYISEIVASGNEMFPDPQGEYDDWIEIYNDNEYAVDLGGLFISDSLAKPAMHQIPGGNPGLTTVAAKGFIVLWADGQPEQGALHLGFKLNGEGEQVALSGMDGKTVIDTVTFPDLYKHFSYSRMLSKGEWKFLRPTPAALNLNPPVTGIRINEYMTSSTTYTDEFGEFDDWIELFNDSDEPVDIGGIYLTDSIGNPTKYRIPSHSPHITTIEPGGYCLVYADDQSDQGINHTSFKLSREGEQIALFHYDGETIIDSLTYGEQFRNASCSLIDGSGDWYSIPATPGTANVLPDLTGLVINELMGDNRTAYADNFGEYNDWIELFNGGAEELDIGGLFLTDSLADRTMFRISSEHPDSTTIQAGGHLVLWADNSEEQGILHVSLKIAKTGEEIGLFSHTGDLVDSVTYPFISPNLSWGRRSDGNPDWVKFSVPTPLMSNQITLLNGPENMEETVRMYPNPVTDHAIFVIPVEGQARIRIEVMNSLGAVISLLEENTMDPGNQAIFWDASDASGGRLESGFYIYRISVGSSLFSGKFLVR
jgi:hypothetical protein